VPDDRDAVRIQIDPPGGRRAAEQVVEQETRIRYPLRAPHVRARPPLLGGLALARCQLRSHGLGVVHRGHDVPVAAQVGAQVGRVGPLAAAHRIPDLAREHAPAGGVACVDRPDADRERPPGEGIVRCRRSLHRPSVRVGADTGYAHGVFAHGVTGSLRRRRSPSSRDLYAALTTPPVDDELLDAPGHLIALCRGGPAEDLTDCAAPRLRDLGL
jgi:hypothetical protein